MWDQLALSTSDYMKYWLYCSTAYISLAHSREDLPQLGRLPPPAVCRVREETGRAQQLEDARRAALADSDRGQDRLVAEDRARAREKSVEDRLRRRDPGESRSSRM